MTVASLPSLLADRPYPGRGVLAARLPGDRLSVAYFLTGRSPASRQRALVKLENGDVAVASTETEVPEDALRHYVALAHRRDVLVLGNGSQVEPLAVAIAHGADVLGAFGEHDFEPDPPIHTPRVWLCARRDEPVVVFGAAMRSPLASSATVTGAWALRDLAVGEGWLLSTYAGDADTVRTAAAPQPFTVDATDPAALLDAVWSALAPELAVAALAVDVADEPGDVLIRS